MVLLAEFSAKWIIFDYLSLTSFDFCISPIAACSEIVAIIVRCIFNFHILMHVRCIFVECLRDIRCIFIICCLESCSPHIR